MGVGGLPLWPHVIQITLQRFDLPIDEFEDYMGHKPQASLALTRLLQQALSCSPALPLLSPTIHCL